MKNVTALEPTNFRIWEYNLPSVGGLTLTDDYRFARSACVKTSRKQDDGEGYSPFVEAPSAAGLCSLGLLRRSREGLWTGVCFRLPRVGPVEG